MRTAPTPAPSIAGSAARAGGILTVTVVAALLLAAPVASQSPAVDPSPTPVASPTPYASPSPVVGPAGEMVEILTRYGYFNAESVEVEVMIAPPPFWCVTGFWADALDMGADQYLTIVATQWHHGIFEGRPEQFVPILQEDGASFHVPVLYHLLADDGHRRTTGMVFGDLPLSILEEPHRLELMMPATPDGVRGTVGWDTPLEELPVVDMSACQPGPPREITASHEHAVAPGS